RRVRRGHSVSIAGACRQGEVQSKVFARAADGRDGRGDTGVRGNRSGARCASARSRRRLSMATRISVSSPAPADRSDTAERVVRIAYVDPQSYHGLAKYDAGYLRGLRDAGFDGELLFYCSKLFEEPAPKGVALRPIFSYNRKRFAALKAFSYIRSMVSIVIDSFLARADVYHFQWFKLPPIDYLFVLVMRRLAHVRVVMTAHNVAPHGDEGGDHRWLGLLYRSVDAVIVHNEKTAQEIAERFSVALARISVLRHGPIKTEARGRTR